VWWNSHFLCLANRSIMEAADVDASLHHSSWNVMCPQNFHGGWFLVFTIAIASFTHQCWYFFRNSTLKCKRWTCLVWKLTDRSKIKQTDDLKQSSQYAQGASSKSNRKTRQRKNLEEQSKLALLPQYWIYSEGSHARANSFARF